jgi:membrane glycosyltransferase
MSTELEAPAATAEDQREQRRAHNVDKALRLYFGALAYQDSPVLERLLQFVHSTLPAKCSPSQAVAHAGQRIDGWLLDMNARCGLPLPPTIEASRAALIALDMGRAWPDALLSPAPDAAFVAAYRAALPIAHPPEQGLPMPEQSLHEWTVEHASTGVSAKPWVRRGLVFGLAFGSTGAATFQLYRVFEPGEVYGVEIVLMVLFAINFVWIALTFWSALAGLAVLWRGGLPPGLEDTPRDTRLRERTAVLMPTYNENPVHIFSALETIYESIRATGHLDAFEFFVLSDTTDANVWVQEEIAWDITRRRLGATGRFFYRRRFENTGRKAGNIAEFCKRWGGRYAQMLVLDADSLMAGDTIVRLAQLMEANPGVGILQTVPRLVNRNTLFARAQQFAGRMYGPVLAAGLSYWHLGDSNYWGHNAIIRVRAFAGHAGMPVLIGRPPFGGHILSHDFVEAALMRRAGWRVFLLPDLAGSYEESPPSLIDHAQRDRRWCQGNLQHIAVLRASGLHPLSRFHLLTGIMSYLASPLWFLFILVGILAALQGRFQLPEYFFPSETPYPVWHIIDAELAAWLFGTTMIVLLAPKFFGFFSIFFERGAAREFGGYGKAFLGVLAETVFSSLIAPVQMLFQSQFVMDVFLGRDSGWKTQNRDDRGIPWAESFRRHRGHMIMGTVLAVAAYAVYPGLLAWMSPALLGMLLAAPVSCYGSRPSTGLAFRAHGIFTIPEENAPPPILSDAAHRLEEAEAEIVLPRSGLQAVAGDNRVGSLHLAMLSQDGPKQRSEAMLLASYNACLVKTPEELVQRFDARLTAGALADKASIARLRRSIGRFR